MCCSSAKWKREVVPDHKVRVRFLWADCRVREHRAGHFRGIDPKVTAQAMASDGWLIGQRLEELEEWNGAAETRRTRARKNKD